MKPLFFGSVERHLYGIYHPPTQGGGSHAVLLCYPGVQEYNATHWAFRRLAGMLGRAGCHVLRFDYFGTGDSSGELREGTPEIWMRDIRDAAQELLDLSGVRHLSLVGMRLGAALGTLASSEGLRMRKLILWEPVVSGRAYVRELERRDARRNLLLLHASRTRGRRDELLGHPFPTDVRFATEQIELTRTRTPLADQTVIFAEELRPEHDALRAAFEQAGVPTTVKRIAEPTLNAVQDRERALLSSNALVDIVREFRELGTA